MSLKFEAEQERQLGIKLEKFEAQEKQRESISSRQIDTNMRPSGRQSMMNPKITFPFDLNPKQRPKSMEFTSLGLNRNHDLVRENSVTFEKQFIETKQVEQIRNKMENNHQKPPSIVETTSEPTVPKSIRSELKLFLRKISKAITGDKKSEWSFPISQDEETPRLAQELMKPVTLKKKGSTEDMFSPRLTTETMGSESSDMDSPHNLDTVRTERKSYTLDKNYPGYFLNPMAAFQIPEIHEGMELWLTKNANLDFWNLLNVFTDISPMTGPPQKEVFDVFWRIIDEYIHPNSRRDLSMISKSTKSAILKKIEHIERGKWDLYESPLDVLDVLKTDLLSYFSYEIYPKWIKTEDGFARLTHLQHNTQVMSKNSSNNIFYKLSKIWFGQPFSKKETNAMADLADSHCFQYTYLLTNWKIEMENEGKVYSEDLDKNCLNIKLVVLGNTRSSLVNERGFFEFLSPVDVPPPLESDRYHFGLMIGPILFEWSEFELCIPKQSIPGTAILAANLDVVFTLKQFDMNISRLAEVITSWNLRKKYKTMDEGDFATSWKFCETVLGAIGIRDMKLPSSIRDLVAQIKEKGTCDFEFKPSSEFQKTFKAKKSVSFKSHANLDELVYKCIEVDPKFEQNFKDDYAILKAVDSANWMRNVALSREVQETFARLQELTKDRLVKTLNGAPFKELESLSREIKHFEKNQKCISKMMEKVEPHQIKTEQSYLKDHCPFRTRSGFEFFL